MGYATNPFNSEAGKNILKENFRLVFARSRKDPKDIEAKNLRDITRYFVDNTEQIINNIMKFSKGHRPIVPADAGETGIYVCPHCLRRDWMNLWEFESLGYYQPGSMGNESLKFQKYMKGSGFQSSYGGTYPTLARVKCNKVYSCNSCHTTHLKSPNRCDNCSKTDFTVVGCEKSSYAEHFTRSLDINQLFASPQKDGSVSVSQNSHYTESNLSKNSQLVKSILVTPTAFEYSNNSKTNSSSYSPRNQNYESMMGEIPSLNVAYSNKKLMEPNDANCVAKPRVKKFPISPMQLLRWPAPPRFICCAYSHRNFDTSSRWDFSLGKELGTSYWCTSTDRFGLQHGKRYLKKHHGLDNSMRPTITSPNPLPPTAVQPKKYGGKPIYRITLEMRHREHTDETYQYSLLLPAKFSLQSFIEDISELPINQGGTELCPNDPVIEEILDEIDCDELNALGEFTPATRIDKETTVQDLINAGRSDVVDIITKYAKGIVKEEVSQITFEGSSERGVLMNNKYHGWVDYSSKVLNAGGELVPRYLFINKNEKEGKQWLATLCKTLNDFPRGNYTFMNFGNQYRGHSSPAEHLFTPKFLSERHLEERLIPVLAGTPCSISTSAGNEAVFSTEFWRKLRGVKLKSDGKTTFVPIETKKDTSFLPTYLVSKMKLPICTINGQVTKLVQGAQKKLRPTHSVLSGVQYIDESMLTVYTVLRCQTCNEIFDEGGVMNYRSARGWVSSATGLITGKPRFYTQKAFDTELAHEMAAGSDWEPFTTSDGFRVCPNWGIDSMQKYGKAMLKATYSTGSKGLGQSMDVGVRSSRKKGKK